jgi:hypothetical protein
MDNAFQLFRALIIYGVCLPLAIYIGYLMATPYDTPTLPSMGILFGLLTIPLFLRWHYPWVIAAWNTTAGLYFLPGKPSLTMVMIFVSFSISMLAYIMNRNLKFISVPSITRPLLCVLAVVLVTADLTHSLGLNVLGSDNVGGKRYLYIIAATLGYFALTAQRIPENKAKLYVALFFLGMVTAAIGTLASIVSPSWYFIFTIFPADSIGPSSAVGGEAGIARMAGLSMTCTALLNFMLSRYGISGVLDPKRYGRLFAFIAIMGLGLFGGFRSKVIELMLICTLLFFMEGLYRSRLLPVLILAMILGGTLIVPFSNRLPISMQRSLAFLPLDFDKEAEENARASTEWRLEMWKNDVLPIVPQYLILGKGLGIDAHDLDMANAETFKRTSDSAGNSALAGDYHNGPLSLIVPFGIPGVLAFLWFLVAGGRVLYRNYKYSGTEYVNLNRFLLVYYMVRVIIFFGIFGSFYSDLAFFVGPIGLSIALNGGVRSPAVEPVRVRPVLDKFKLASVAR